MLATHSLSCRRTRMPQIYLSTILTNEGPRSATIAHIPAPSWPLRLGRVSSLGTGSHRPLGATLMCCRSPAGSDPFFHYYELSFRSSGSTLIVEEEEDQAEVGQRGDPRSVLELHV